MTDPLRTVHSGEAFPRSARTINLWNDAARDLLERRASPFGIDPAGSPPAVTIQLRNQSGADIEAYDVLGLDGPTFAPDAETGSAIDLHDVRGVVVFDGVTPVRGTHEGLFAVVQEPIANGELGDAVVVGVTPVNVSVTAETDTFVEIADASTRLATGTTGSWRILWKQAGTGNRIAVIAPALGSGDAGVFPVDLDRVGGSQGSGATPASWTYDVYPLGADQMTATPIATALAPEYPRQTPRVQQATRGLAYRDAAGDVVLFIAAEAPVFVVCAAP